ncbi:MAG: helix-turn-helix domain-containing protein [Thermodesulfobacteriota bacterium]
MVEQPVGVSFGQLLKSARTAKGSDLRELSDKTKISLKVLRQIENEDHGGLPDPAYVKGFLRLYAAAVNVDEEETVRSYLKSRLEYERMAAMSAAGYSNGGRFWVNMLISVGALGIVIALSMYMISDAGIPKRAEEPPEYPVETVSEPAPPSEPGTQKSQQDKSPSGKALESWILEVAAVDDTWLKVIIDDQASREYKLKKNERLELMAGERFNVLIGNSAAVKLNLNGNPVTFPAKNGQIVTLDLP